MISRVRVSRYVVICCAAATVSRAASAAGSRLDGPGGTWTRAHRRWLAAQRFEHPASELAFLDTLAAVDGLVARKAALDECLSRLALHPLWWPTVARLRCFRGIHTLSALALHLEVHDWQRFRRPTQLASSLGLTPSLAQSVQSSSTGRSRRPAPATPAGSLSRPPNMAAATPDRRHPRQPPGRPARPRPPYRLARPTAPPPPDQPSA